MSTLSVPIRILIAMVFLVGVNLASGLFAVEFGYPSLWGNSKVFAEYAYPLPMGWAFAHWLTMLPLAWVAYAMWEWPGPRLRMLRWSLAAAMVTCVVLDLVQGGGRWHRVPFLLFALVDLSAIFGLSLLMSKRTLMFAVPVGVLGLLSAAITPVLLDAAVDRNRNIEFDRIVSKNALLRPVSVRRLGEQTVYAIEILRRETAASEEAICDDAVWVYEEMLRLHEPEDGTVPVIEFSKQGETAVAGTARYTTHGRWLCQVAVGP